MGATKAALLHEDFLEGLQQPARHFDADTGTSDKENRLVFVEAEFHRQVEWPVRDIIFQTVGYHEEENLESQTSSNQSFHLRATRRWCHTILSG